PVTILFEGEEESGSPSLPGFLDAHTDDLRADMALVCDTNMWDRDTPAITTRLRGMYGTELVIQAADKDLHSGYFGGAARNPAHVLAAIIADLHDENGAVTLPGFYDGVAEVPDAIMAMWQQLDFSAEAFLGEVGLSVPAGEADRSVLEQIWARPTLEVNGMTSGYTGDGFKTVLPAQASAKISCRLVKGQDPQQVHESFEAFVKARLPADCTATFNTKGMGPGIELDTSGASFVAAQKALTDEWPNPAAFIGVGGSIPIVGDFQNRLGLESVLVGFGLGDDQIHSPNEKYELESYRKGIRSWIRILYALGGSGMNSVCVFCGSNPGNHPDYAAAAEALGNTLAQRGLTLIYGGAEVGLMGTVADAALAAGGEVVGVIPQALVDKEIAHKGLSRLETVGSMHERKARMADLSDGFINLPGGTGTLEEMFEVWTWGQLGFHSKPIGVLNVRGFYDPLMVFLDHQRDEGFVKPGLRETLLSSPDAGALLDAMEAYRPPVVHKWVERKAL
ncbi:MAG: TIGR00730 family Rossman fold protein, partial [Devosiaceae bacterium]|nr:TIGR00730 family Rossman fold protein [Devosiaceae bacterium MH13]